MLCTVIFVMATSGCQTIKAPSSQSEFWVPPKSTRQKDSSDAVWQGIRSQKIEASRPLTLDELIDIALLNSPSTRKAWESARLAEAEKNQEESAYYPQFTLDAQAGRQKTSGTLPEMDANYLQYGPALKVTYLLIDFGGRSGSVGEMVEALVSANYQFNQAMQDLVLAVEINYYNLHSARSSLEAAESDVKNAEASYQAAKHRFEVGLAAKLDMLQAKATYEESLYSLENARGELKSAKAQLAKVLGYPADINFAIAEPGKELPQDITDEDITILINDAIQNRSDIHALRADLRSKKAAVTAANSDLYPSISIGGSYEKYWYKYYEHSRPREDDRTYGAALTFEWDVFDGFEHLNELREAEADVEVSRAELMDKELEASAEVWTKYYDFKTAIKKLEYSEAFLSTAQSSYELAFDSYNNGLKSMLDLLDAESKLSDAKSKLIQSKKDLFVALAELAHASGTIYTSGDIKYEPTK